ncbi:hypothetical protein BT69DRAFT_722953 [Atractiella rhizophila]|nr:hypothetical protein BT69DRAFT_722953 [Atractiella rhizophila]
MTLHQPPSIRSPPSPKTNLLALSVVSKHMRTLIIPLLFQDLFLPAWKKRHDRSFEDYDTEPSFSILPLECVLAATRFTVKLRGCHLWQPLRLHQQLQEVLTFSTNEIPFVRLVVTEELIEDVDSHSDAYVNSRRNLVNHIFLSVWSARSVCKLQLEMQSEYGQPSLYFFNDHLESLNMNSSITDLVLRGCDLEGACDIASCLPSLRSLRLDSSSSLDGAVTSETSLTHFPPIQALEIVSTVCATVNDDEELRWSGLCDMLALFAASLQFLSIQRIFQLHKVDEKYDYPKLSNLRTLELIDRATFVHQLAPIDWILGLDCFATSSASTLFLDQVPSPNPNPDLQADWEIALTGRPKTLGFHFSPLRDIRFQFWEYAMHTLAHEKRTGRWQELERLRFGQYASDTLSSDEDVALKWFTVLKGLGISVSTYAEPEIPPKGWICSFRSKRSKH